MRQRHVTLNAKQTKPGYGTAPGQKRRRKQGQVRYYNFGLVSLSFK